MSAFKEISPEDLNHLSKEKEDLKILDVRNPHEFEKERAHVAVNLPLSDLTAAKVEAMGFSKNQPIHIICNSGGRSARACDALLEEGFKDVFNVVGGTKAWVAKGLPASKNPEETE